MIPCLVPALLGRTLCFPRSSLPFKPSPVCPRFKPFHSDFFIPAGGERSASCALYDPTSFENSIGCFALERTLRPFLAIVNSKFPHSRTAPPFGGGEAAFESIGPLSRKKD
jgi:hypothetical protein